MWGGSCFGLTATAILFVKDYYKISDYNPYANNLYEISSSDGPKTNSGRDKKLRELIESYQIKQSGEYLQSLNNSRINNYAGLIRAVEEAESNNEAVLVEFLGHHAVTAYKIESKTQEECRILIADCNSVGEDGLYRVIFKGENYKYTSWSYDYESDYASNKGINISYLTASDLIVSNKDNMMRNARDSSLLVITTGDEIRLENQQCEIISVNNNILTSDIEGVYLIDAIEDTIDSEASDDQAICLYVPVDAYTVVSNSTNKESVKTDISTRNTSISLSSESGTKFNASLANDFGETALTNASSCNETKISLLGESAYEVEFENDTSLYDNGYENIGFSGVSTGNEVITEKVGTVKLENVSESTISVNEGDNLKTIKVEGVTETVVNNGILKIATDSGEKELIISDKKVDIPKPSAIKVSGITISGISKQIAASKRIALKVNIIPYNATNKSVTWKSSNTKYAKVSSTGVVTTYKKGRGHKVVITATAMDNSGKKNTYTINIAKGVVSKIKVSGAKSVKAGSSLKLKAKVSASKGANKKLKWESSNPKYATVSASGKVKTKKAGKGKTVKITVRSTDGSNKRKSVKIKLR